MVRKRILNELFDIRPVVRNRIAWSWIAKVKPVLNLRGEFISNDRVHRFKIIRAAAYPETRFSLSLRTPESTTAVRKLSVTQPKPEQKTAHARTPAFRFVFSWPRAFRFAAGAAVVLLATGGIFSAYSGVMLRRELISAGSNGAALMREGLKQAMVGNYNDAAIKFAQAQTSFAHAHTALVHSPVLLRAALQFSPLNTAIDSGTGLLEAGEEMSQAAELIAASLNDALTLQDPESALDMTGSVGNIISQLHERFTQAGEHLDRAATALKDVDPGVFPRNVQEDVVQLNTMLPGFQQSFGSFRAAADAAFDLLGFNGTREYIVLLENSSELRPTGGFVGNIGRLKVVRGRVASFTIQDVYDLDGQIVHHTVPPKPIQGISTAWSLHDANWFRDFPTSAKLSADFFGEVTGIKPDGVFTITSGVLEDALAVLGPQTLPSGVIFESGTAVDAINRIGLLQHEGETIQAHAIQELSDALREHLKNLTSDMQQKLAGKIFERMLAGDIMAWFPSVQNQRFADSLGMSGKLLSPEHDALAVVHSNINGFKTDAVVQDHIDFAVEVTPSGEIFNTVTLTRRHTFRNRTDPLYGRVNKDYVRLYVPKGSELLSVSGNTKDAYVPPIDYATSDFRVASEVEIVEAAATVHEPDGAEVFEESGRTVFGAWLFVSPGEEVKASFRYKLASSVKVDEQAPWTVLLEKQPGVVATVNVTVKAPEGFVILSPDANKAQISSLFSGALRHTEVLGFSVLRQ